jgi:uncharacterized protein (TIGR00269 family)
MRLVARARCHICGDEAIACLHTSRTCFCKKHYNEYLKKRVYETIKKYRMFKSGDKVVVGISGGKDSLSLLSLLHDIKGVLGIKILPVFIDLGIKSYSLKAERASRKVSESLGTPLLVIRLKELIPYGLWELSVAAKRPVCSVCGLLKRYLLNAVGLEADAVVATGHTLDDTAAYLLKRVLVGSQEENTLFPVNPKVGGGAKKVKPLILVYERDLLVYSLANGLPFLHEKCPYYSRKILETKIRRFFYIVEEDHPGLMISFVKKGLQKEKSMGETRTCMYCGTVAMGNECSLCKLTKRVFGEPMGKSIREKIREKLASYTFV